MHTKWYHNTSLATIVTQYGKPNIKGKNSILRWRKAKLSTVKLQDVQTKVYTGEKNPFMPKSYSIFGVLPKNSLLASNDSSKK